MQRDYSNPTTSPRPNRNPYAVPGKTRASLDDMPHILGARDTGEPVTVEAVVDTVTPDRTRISVTDVPDVAPSQPKRSIVDRLRGKAA